MLRIRYLIVFILMVVHATSSFADEAAEMARKLQDPLANIKALMTDNGISGAGRNGYSTMLIGFVG